LQRLDYGRARQVVTVPVQTLSNNDDVDFATAIVEALQPEHGGGGGSVDQDDTTPTIVLPDAVAAVWGAQHEQLLPLDDVLGNPTTSSSSSHTTMVVDIGGLVTQCSMVHRDICVASVALPLGGETLVELVQEHTRLEAFGKEESSSSSGGETKNNNNKDTFLTDARSLAALQVQARAATLQFTSTTTTASSVNQQQQVVPIHVPYVFSNPNNHHLDTTLSTSVLKSLLDEHIQQQHDDSDLLPPYLSPHLPPPTDVTTLLTSALTQLMEQGQRLPTSIDHVLVVGAASRSRFFLGSLLSSLEQVALTTTTGTTTVVVPSSASQASELTVLGATTMLPNYEYTMDKGLQRRDVSS